MGRVQIHLSLLGFTRNKQPPILCLRQSQTHSKTIQSHLKQCFPSPVMLSIRSSCMERIGWPGKKTFSCTIHVLRRSFPPGKLSLNQRSRSQSKFFNLLHTFSLWRQFFAKCHKNWLPQMQFLSPCYLSSAAKIQQLLLFLAWWWQSRPTSQVFKWAHVWPGLSVSAWVFCLWHPVSPSSSCPPVL